jgi:hypothetical protein
MLNRGKGGINSVSERPFIRRDMDEGFGFTGKIYRGFARMRRIRTD